MLKFFRNKTEDKNIYSPITGSCFSIDLVKDDVFANKMMGEGIAFTLDSTIVCSPCDGKLSLIANTGHSFGIIANNGLEILVHIGLNTVNLEGKGFSVLKRVGEYVKKGEAIIEVDKELLDNINIDLTTMLVVTNSSEHTLEVKQVNDKVHIGKDIVITKL